MASRPVISAALWLALLDQNVGATCPDDADVDLCDDDSTGFQQAEEELDESSSAFLLQAPSRALVMSLALAPVCGKHSAWLPLIASIAGLATPAAAAGDYDDAGDHSGLTMTCGDWKQLYKDEECCGEPEKISNYVSVPKPHHRSGTNPCHNAKALTQGDPDTGPEVREAMDNFYCFEDAVRQAGEQAGGDVTRGYLGSLETDVVPISVPYFKTALCPVNVHWHLGAEHRSEGEYDEAGTSPGHAGTPDANAPAHADGDRRLDESPRYGYSCHHYDAGDSTFTTEYAWKHCLEMHVGETYEVHWPHSALGACGTPNQYQSPFYDGVFCHATSQLLGSLEPQNIADNVGVQGQVFTIVNDEQYYYPDLIRGMIVDVDHDMGQDVAVYTGSTTGTSRDNEVCSAYTPITWQVDRKCHLISASSFDKMCADMKQMRDDMSMDLHPHGARELVLQELSANNQADLDPAR